MVVASFFFITYGGSYFILNIDSDFPKLHLEKLRQKFYLKHKCKIAFKVVIMSVVCKFSALLVYRTSRFHFAFTNLFITLSYTARINLQFDYEGVLHLD